MWSWEFHLVRFAACKHRLSYNIPLTTFTTDFRTKDTMLEAFATILLRLGEQSQSPSFTTNWRVCACQRECLGKISSHNLDMSSSQLSSLSFSLSSSKLFCCSSKPCNAKSKVSSFLQHYHRLYMWFFINIILKQFLHIHAVCSLHCVFL